MSLRAQLAARIAQDGPISIADYMRDCLMHPTFGYYATRDPFGAEGDFITAPEISQMFGELLGLCLAQAWMDQGRPGRFILAELGPGRGVLMADVLRATARVPGFLDAAQIALVETSPKLRTCQAKTLKGHEIRFPDSVEDLPGGPLFLVSNEFFDALPIRQYQRSGAGWRERRVGLDGDALCLGLGPVQPVPDLSHRLEDTGEGDIVETSPAARAVAESIGQRIADAGGAALVIDYGDWRSLGDTLQAVRAHRPADVLSDPGACDLTAHVDFEALAMAAPCRHTRLTPQGVFLERLGISARAQALAQGADSAGQETLLRAHRRLTHPEEMGNLFKVMGFFPDGAPPPAGLDV